MRRNLLAVFLFLWSFSIHAQTLFVSDVDDTIKLANVKDLSEAARYAFDDTSRFTGMSELYNLVARDQANLKMVYLSKAPQWLMGRTHRKFLQNGKFPAGVYIPRTEYSSDVHKLKTLRSLMNSMKPRKVIFIGDNGEQDADIYAQIAKEYANQGIEFHQFIRIVYGLKTFFDAGTPLHEGQIGFVTPIEISLELEKERILDSSSVQWMMENVAKNISMQNTHTAEGDVAFPYFVNCTAFVWKWDDSLVRFDVLRTLKDRLVDRCKLRP